MKTKTIRDAKGLSGALFLLLLSLMLGTKQNWAAEGESDNMRLRAGPAPELEYTEGEADVLVKGVRLFLDGDYRALEVPSSLSGRSFVRFNSVLGRAVCRRAGVVYVLVRVDGGLGKRLVAQGFERANIEPFQLIEMDSKPIKVEVYQKELARDEPVAFGRIGLGGRGEFAILVAAGDQPKLARRRASELAADKTRYEIWDSTVPLPNWENLPDLEVVTHVNVERAQRGGYHYLHESAIAWHNGILYAGWANHGLLEVNTKDERVRGRRSRDGGYTWEAPTDWALPPQEGSDAFNHPVIVSQGGQLWGFFTRWNKKLPSTQIFRLDEKDYSWRPVQAFLPGFIPLTPPREMGNGKWIMGGELHYYEAAVATCESADFTDWKIVKLPRPAKLRLHFPETTLLQFHEEIIAFCRPREALTALVSISRDYGQTWSELQVSNFPMFDSKPLAGKLSNGQTFVITNHLEQERTLLTIAVTEPGSKKFTRMWKIRHQQTPMRRLLGTPTAAGIATQGNANSVGAATEWSYPSAVEHDGKLFISYTQGKEDCVLSIIPIAALAVK